MHGVWRHLVCMLLAELYHTWNQVPDVPGLEATEIRKILIFALWVAKVAEGQLGDPVGRWYAKLFILLQDLVEQGFEPGFLHASPPRLDHPIEEAVCNCMGGNGFLNDVQGVISKSFPNNTRNLGNHMACGALAFVLGDSLSPGCAGPEVIVRYV